MNLFNHHVPAPEPDSDEHPLLPFHEQEHDTSEGSEFLDDAIRMHDQPLMRNEDAIAAGAANDLL